MRWRLRLSKAPSQQRLDYSFMRASFDHTQASALQNIHHTVFTPKNASLGSSIVVELIVKEDGTTEPTFVYGHGEQGRNTIVKGSPFALDMTYAANEKGVDTYLGFALRNEYVVPLLRSGGRYQSFCAAFLRQNVVKSQLACRGPALSCLAPSCSIYVRDWSQESGHWGREALEAILVLITYLCYQEHCIVKDRESSYFKGVKRSAGPIWDLLKRCVEATGDKWTFSREALRLRDGAVFEELDNGVSQIAMAKHGKLAEGLDYPRLLEQVGNVLNKVMDGKVLGFFEDIRLMPFSKNRHSGIFRNARGPSLPFIDIYQYEGADNYPAEYVFAFDVEKQQGLPLYPIILRGLDTTRSPLPRP